MNDDTNVLSMLGYPQNAAVNIFPGQIPDKAKNVRLHDHPALGQGGTELSLRFEIETESMAVYARRAAWMGRPQACNAQETGIFPGVLSLLEDEAGELPNNWMLYLIHSKPYQSDDWNHGESSLIAICAETNEILFRFEDW